MQKDCHTWACVCQSCQRSKVSHHIGTPLGDCTPRAARFLHVGPLLTLPLVLLRICMAFKEDLQASVAELMFSESIRIPGELLTPTAYPVDPALLITELCQYMACLRPVLAARHASRATVVH
jgi:hypothetical protein